MSSRKLTWRAEVCSSKLKPSVKLVLFAISIRMNEHGEGAFPSVKTIAADAGVSERTVQRAVAMAVEAGFLEVVKRFSKTGGSTSNEYRQSWPKEPNKAQNSGDPPGDTPVTPPGDTLVTPGVTHLSPPGDTSVTPIPLNLVYNYGSSYEEPNTATVPSEPLGPGKTKPKKKTPLTAWQEPRFAEFWNAYWVKSGKVEAERAFSKVVRDQETFDAVMAGVRRQSAMQLARRAAGGTPKYAQGWLNNRRWEDEVVGECGAGPQDDEREKIRKWKEEELRRKREGRDLFA